MKKLEFKQHMMISLAAGTRTIDRKERYADRCWEYLRLKEGCNDSEIELKKQTTVLENLLLARKADRDDINFSQTLIEQYRKEIKAIRSRMNKILNEELFVEHASTSKKKSPDFDLGMVSDFLVECCEQTSSKWTKASAIYSAYQEWSGLGSLMSSTMFGRCMRDLGFDKRRGKKKKSSGGHMYRLDIL